MEAYLILLGFDDWDSVVNGYKIPKNPLTDLIERKESEYNVKFMNAILGGLSKTKFFRVMNYDKTKEIWDKLKNVYHHDTKVQK